MYNKRMDIPPTIAAELAIARQNVALSVIKQAAEAERGLATILDQALRVPPTGRGSRVNFSA